jgi:DNA replication and repair protein RecF
MILKELTLNNFKNIEQASLSFSPKINCFLGNNGMGKSNLLDAIYYFSFCKSFTGVTDAMLINREQDYMIMTAQYERRDIEENLAVGITRGRRKSFKRGGKEYQRLSAHIGAFPLVMVSPRDMDLITGSGEERRRFIDMVISQSDARYLDHLIRYNQALTQRNTMLRNNITDVNLYIAIEMTMAASVDYIVKARSEKIAQLTEIFKRYYNAIAPEDDDVSLAYSTQLSEGTDYATLLESARQRDVIMRHTTVGPHRDDIEMNLLGMPVKKTASQGQSKTYTIALRFAQYEFLKETSTMQPLLLLDDIFDKLDASRVERIMGVVGLPMFGQIFVTDTNRKHLDEIMTHIGGDYRMWNVENGVFTPITSE